jgi:hypothetical protein
MSAKRKVGIISAEKKKKIKEIITFVKDKLEKKDVSKLKELLEDLGRKMPKGVGEGGKPKAKRPLSGYMIFLAEFRKKHKDDYDSKEIVKEGAKEWNALGDAGKAKYNNKSKSGGKSSGGKKGSAKKSSAKKGSAKKSSATKCTAALKKKLAGMSKTECSKQPAGTLQLCTGKGKGTPKSEMCELLGAGKKKSGSKKS